MIEAGTNAVWVRGRRCRQCRVISIYDCLGGVARVDLLDGLEPMIVKTSDLVRADEHMRRLDERRQARIAAREQAGAEQWKERNADAIANYLATGKRWGGMNASFLAKAKRLGMIPEDKP